MRRLALLLALLALSGCAATRIQRVDQLDRYQQHVRTDDGWEIAVFREPPAPGTEDLPHHGEVVLLAHGTSVNRLNLSFVGADLAAWLSERGFDVWIPEYRGDRSCRPPTQQAWIDGDWDADGIAHHDIPAVLDLIEERTGRRRVWWVGHSLGGTLGYIVAQGPRADAVAGIVAIGSPGTFAQPNDMARLAHRFRGLIPRHGQVPSRLIARWFVPVLDLGPRSDLVHAVVNMDNLSPSTALDFIEPAFENIGRGLADQYMRWVASGRVTSRDGSVDYTAGLARITVPTLFFAGRVDNIVPAWTVRGAYDRVGSADRTWIVLGRGWGTEHDYGHGDLVLGNRVEEEVFPRVAAWLISRAQGRADALPELESAVDDLGEITLPDD